MSSAIERQLTTRRVLAGAGVFLFALLCRAATWRQVFTDEGVLFGGIGDPYYHMRRIWYSVVQFPRVLQFDAYVGHPQGVEITWAPGFDLGVAALVRLLVGADDQAAAERVAVWVPALLGALHCVAVAALGARVFSPVVGLLAGLMLAALPAAILHSGLGMLDHHVAIALAATLLVFVATVPLRRGPGQRWPAAAVALGLLSAGALLSWPGSLLHVAMLQALAALWTLSCRDAAVARSRAWHLALAHLVAASALAPHALGRSWSEFGDWSPLVLCSFQPVWFAAGATVFALAASLWRTPALGGTPMHRGFVALLCGGAVLLATALAFPELLSSVRKASDWSGGEGGFQRFVAELQPLRPGGAGTLLSPLVFAYPVALLWLAARALRRGRADWWLLVAWGACFFAASLRHQRFVNSLAAPFVLVTCAWLVALVRVLAGRLPARMARAAGWGVALLVLAFSWPIVSELSARIALLWQPPRYTLATAQQLQYRRAARWLRDHSPPTRGYLDPQRRAEYATLTSWGLGHLVRYVSERPQLQDGFVVYGSRASLEAAEAYFAADDEQQAVDVLSRFGVRYLLVDRNGSGQGDDYAQGSMAHRLYVPRAARAGGPQQLALASLAHHRLLHETSLVGGDGLLMLYERVSGARIQGRAAPGGWVHAVLEVRSQERGLPFRYRTRVRADEHGAYELRLPYATGAQGPVETAAHYIVSCRGDSDELEVTERAVREGGVQAGPQLSCTPRGS